VKEGVLHVQPPPQVLDKMITLRVHLDDTHEENGCLRVIPRSHQLGLLTPDEIHQYVSCSSPVSCVASAGSVLVMRPHLLHASNKAINPARRRVIHIEYSSYQLPSGVSWA
jgi:ectoine hydroxylase-related dioxygenase (phytanoyl-CoA dioxygenase family)